MTCPRDIPAEDFQRIFEHASSSLLVLLPDPAFTIVAASDAYLADTLTRREEILGRPVFEVFPDNPHVPDVNATRNLRASLERVIATGKADTMAIQRYDVRSPDGAGFELRYWSPVNTPVLAPDGSISYIVHRVENVTDYMRLAEENEAHLREATELSAQNRKIVAEVFQQGVELDARNRELREANAELSRYAHVAREEARSKDEFLAMLAHELRNPLAGISASLELLGIVGSDTEKEVQLRAICERQLGNLTRLVDDLLDVSRVNRGAVDLRSEPLDLRDVLTSAMHAVRPLFDERALAVGTTIASGSYPMLGDSTRLEQVLTNLLGNAAKYTGNGGRVDILLSTESRDGSPWAVLHVRDTGRGIPSDKLSSVFDMFVQVETGIDRALGGLGIGLTLVQKLVEMHGGEVAVESPGRGKGSTFTVRLPLNPEVSPTGSTSPRVAEVLPHGGGARILIVEDNADAREALKRLLEAFNYVVDEAATGEEGLERLHDRRPDVAIVDIGLPGLDGFEVARRARVMSAGSPVKLVALTGYGGPDAERRAARAGFDLHLVKPVNVAQLADMLRTSEPGKGSD